MVGSKEREKGGATRRDLRSPCFDRIDFFPPATLACFFDGPDTGPAFRTLIPPFKREVSAVIFLAAWPAGSNRQNRESSSPPQFRASTSRGILHWQHQRGRPSPNPRSVVAERSPVPASDRCLFFLSGTQTIQTRTPKTERAFRVVLAFFIYFFPSKVE